MVAKWADEMSDTEPLPSLEPFYILVAIELGDPDQTHSWMRKNIGGKFRELYFQYHQGQPLPCPTAVAIVQYMIWYERESRHVKNKSNP